MIKIAKRKKVRLPTIEEQILLDVSTLLDAKTITPAMIYAIMLDGHRAYKSGIGMSQFGIWEVILKSFSERDRHYINPFKLSALKDKEFPDEEDYEHLKEV